MFKSLAFVDGAPLQTETRRIKSDANLVKPTMMLRGLSELKRFEDELKKEKK